MLLWLMAHNQCAQFAPSGLGPRERRAAAGGLRDSVVGRHCVGSCADRLNPRVLIGGFDRERIFECVVRTAKIGRKADTRKLMAMGAATKRRVRVTESIPRLCLT